MTDYLVHGTLYSESYLRLMIITRHFKVYWIYAYLVESDIRNYTFLYKLQYSGNQHCCMFVKHDMTILVPAGFHVIDLNV